MVGDASSSLAEQSLGQLHLCRLSCFRVRMKKRANLREATPRRGKELGNLFIRFPFLPHANDEGTKAMPINITAKNELLRIGGPFLRFIGVAIDLFKPFSHFGQIMFTLQDIRRFSIRWSAIYRGRFWRCR